MGSTFTQHSKTHHHVSLRIDAPAGPCWPCATLKRTPRKRRRRKTLKVVNWKDAATSAATVSATAATATASDVPSSAAMAVMVSATAATACTDTVAEWLQTNAKTFDVARAQSIMAAIDQRHHSTIVVLRTLQFTRSLKYKFFFQK